MDTTIAISLAQKSTKNYLFITERIPFSKNKFALFNWCVKMESFSFFRLIPRVGGGSSGRVIGVPEGVFKCRFVWQITSRYFLSTGFFSISQKERPRFRRRR